MIINLLVVPPIKKEGEDCGSCYNPDNDYFCGNCSAGLECIKDELLPDAPGKCQKTPSKSISYSSF